MGCEDSVKELVKDAFDDIVDFAEEQFRFVESITLTVWNGIGKKIIEETFNVLGFEDEDVFATEVLTTQIFTEAPDSLGKIAVLNALHTGTDVGDEIVITFVSSISTSINKYIEYGNTTYTHGIPTISTSWRTTLVPVAEDVLESILGEPVTVLEMTLGVPDLEEFAQWDLTNIFNTGSTEYQYSTQNIVDTAADPDLNILLFRDTDVELGNWITTLDHLELDGVTIDTGLSPLIVNHRLSYSTNPEGNWYRVVYYKDSAPSVRFVWYYEVASGTYPDLDPNVESVTSDLTKLLPIIPLRKDFISLDTDSSDPEYITSKELLNKIPLNLDDIVGAIDSNSDIDSIKDSFILFGINLYTQSQVGMKFLYDLFINFNSNAIVDEIQYTNSPDISKSFNIIKLDEQNYNAAIVFSYMTITDHVGVIADVGEYTNVATVLANDPYDLGLGQYGGINSYVTVQYQTDASNYREVIVYGLHQTIIIDTGDSGSFYTAVLEISSDAEAMSNFIFPVPYLMLEDYTSNDRTTLLIEALVLVNYAQSVTHLRYYQTSGFVSLLSAVILIVGLVLSVFTSGASGAATSAFVSALAAGAYVFAVHILVRLILWEMLKQYLVNYAIKTIFRKLMEKAGDDKSKQNIAIAFYVIATFLGSKGSSSFSLSLDLATANLFLEVVQTIVDGFNSITAYQADLLRQEQEDFNDLYNTELEKIQEAADGLNNKEFDILDIDKMTKDSSHNESPSDFFSRTVHTTNPAVATNDQISSYHSSALKLELFTPAFDSIA